VSEATGADIQNLRIERGQPGSRTWSFSPHGDDLPLVAHSEPAASGITETRSARPCSAIWPRWVGDQITLSDLRRSAPGVRDPPGLSNAEVAANLFLCEPA
jgi:hypothetical protein